MRGGYRITIAIVIPVCLNCITARAIIFINYYRRIDSSLQRREPYGGSSAPAARIVYCLEALILDSPMLPEAGLVVRQVPPA